MTTQGELHTITNKGGNGSGNGATGKNNDQTLYLLAVGVLTLAVVIVVVGCFALGFLAVKVLRKHQRETYFQFEEENRRSSQDPNRHNSDNLRLPHQLSNIKEEENNDEA